MMHIKVRKSIYQSTVMAIITKYICGRELLLKIIVDRNRKISFTVDIIIILLI